MRVLVSLVPLGGMASLGLAIVVLGMASGLVANTNNSLVFLALMPACVVNLVYTVVLLLFRMKHSLRRR